MLFTRPAPGIRERRQPQCHSLIFIASYLFVSLSTWGSVNPSPQRAPWEVSAAAGTDQAALRSPRSEI